MSSQMLLYSFTHEQKLSRVLMRSVKSSKTAKQSFFLVSMKQESFKRFTRRSVMLKLLASSFLCVSFFFVKNILTVFNDTRLLKIHGSASSQEVLSKQTGKEEAGAEGIEESEKWLAIGGIFNENFPEISN